MRFFQTLNPLHTPATQAHKGDLAILRERILHTILLMASGALPVVVIGLFELNRTPFFIPAYLLLLFLLNRKLPYPLRGFTLLAIIYLLGLQELAETGKMGELRIYLIVLVSISAVLFNLRTSIAAILIGLVTNIGAWLYVLANPDLTTPAMLYLRSEDNWITSILFYVMISVIIASSISIIIGGLTSNINKQNELVQRLEIERASLEDRVQERTRAMARRMVQLRTAAEISRTISALRDPEEMLQQIVDLIKERFDLYYVGVFLIDSARQNAVLQAATGDPGRKMISDGHQLLIGGTSMIGWAIQHRRPRIALDVGSEAVRFNNPNLPLTRSELALPVITHDDVLGAMTIQSEKPNAFDENDIEILEGIANSLATALDNDRLYRETRLSLEEIRTLNREFFQRAWTETIETYGELDYSYQNPLVVEDEDHPTRTLQVPLMLRDEVIGQVTLEIDQQDFSPEDKTFMENITTQTAIALENARLLHETERRAVQEQKLNELASRFARALSIEEILRAAAQELGQLPAVMDVSVMLNPQITSARHVPPTIGSNGGNGKEHK